MMNKKALKRSLLPLAAALGIATALPVLAQLEEVVVTAQKRAENVQDVGLSVTGLDSNALSKGGIYDVTRIDLLVPGVNFAFIGNDAKFNVRGANSNNTFGDNASIVGVFVDGVYKPRASQQTRQFFDVERVEFLRGPQGTLYGRNTFAGAMNLYTNRPDTEDSYGGVDIGISRFNTFRTEGFVNVPTSDNHAFRFAAFKLNSDGYVKNLAGPDLGADDKFGIRVSSNWEFSDTGSLLTRYSYSDEGGTALGVFSYTGACRYTDSNGLTDAAGSVRDCNNARRGGVGSTPWDRLGPHTVEHDFVNESDLEEHNLTLEYNQELGDAAKMKIIASYTDYDSLIGLDGDSGPNPFERFWFEEDAESFTLEAQFSSNNESAFQWTAGAYYSQDEVFFSFSDFRHTVDDRSGIAGFALTDVNGAPLLDEDSLPRTVDNFIASPLTSLDTSLNGHFADATAVDSDYYGIYFQGEFAITDAFRVIAGIRTMTKKNQ